MAIKRSPTLGKLSDPKVRAALFYAKKRRLARLKAQQEAEPPGEGDEE